MEGPRFRVLGPVGTSEGSPGSPSQLLLLSVLLAHRGQHVRSQMLMDVLWGDQPPRTARQTLRTYISRLRQLLGDRLVASGEGYRLEVASGEVDADRFTRLVQSARIAPAAESAALLKEALQLWRGPAFADTADLEPVRAAARSLDQGRLAARESLCRALVLAGHPDEAVPLAEALVSDEPLDEAGWAVLIRALSACGRPGDALAAYRRARQILTDEGLAPSALLRDAQTAVLRPNVHDHNGGLGPSMHDHGGGVDRDHANLAATAPPALIGRDGDLATVAALLEQNTLVTLVGPGGVGKTSLGLAAVRRRAAHHSAGWRMVELAAVSDGSAVADAIVAGLGLTAESPSPAQTLGRAAALDVVVLLDNCEHVIDEVADAVLELAHHSPAGPVRLRVLATSRERLGVPDEQVWPVQPLATDGDHPAAVQLFIERAAATRPDAIASPPAPDDLAAIRRTVARLDGLPLAIEMAAAQIATLGPIELDARVEGELGHGTDPLGRSTRRGDPRHRTLRAVIEWSRVLLSPAERSALAGWTVFAGSVTADDAIAVLGVEPEVIDVLAARSLLSVGTAAGRTRYRMLRTVRAVAAEPGYNPAPVDRRHAEHFAAVAADADRRLRTAGEAVASARIEETLDEFRTAHAWGRAHDVQLAARLSRSLHLYGVSRLSGQVLDWAARLAPATTADPGLSALVDASVAYRLVMAGELAGARRRAERALAHAPDELIAVHALESLADIAMFEGHLDESAGYGRQLSALAERLGDAHYGLLGRGAELLASAYQGDVEQALALLNEAEKHYEADDLAVSQRGWLAYFRGEALLESDEGAAQAALADAVALADAGGNRYLAGVARVSAVSLQSRAGAPETALPLFAEVLEYWLALASWSHLLTTLRNLVPVLERSGADQAAARLFAAVDRPGLAPSFGAERRRLKQAVARVVSRCGRVQFEAWAMSGAHDDVSAAARHALETVTS